MTLQPVLVSTFWFLIRPMLLRRSRCSPHSLVDGPSTRERRSQNRVFAGKSSHQLV